MGVSIIYYVFTGVFKDLTGIMCCSKGELMSEGTRRFVMAMKKNARKARLKLIVKKEAR